MKQFTFALKNAWLGIASKKLLSGIIIASIAVGLVFPITVLSQMNHYDKFYRQSMYNDIGHTFFLDFFCESLEEPELTELLSVPDCNIKSVGFIATYSTTLVYNGESRISNIAGYNAEYLNVGKTKLLSGRYLTDEELQSGARVCLSKESERVGEKIRVGDTLNIGGADFEVVGIVRDPQLYGGVMIPYNALLKLTDSKKFQYMAYLMTDGEMKTDDIKTYFRLSEDIDELQMLTAEEFQADYFRRGDAIYKKQMIIGVVIALFSVISFALIIVGKVFNEQYIVGVKTAMGATKGQLFRDLVLQNFILIEIASVIAMILSSVMMSFVPGMDGIFDGTVVLAVELLDVVLTLLITAMAFIPVLRKPVTEIFRNGSN